MLASSCCVLPLVLISLGVGGTWIGTLTGLKVYQPLLSTVTVVFLGFAFRRIYRSPGVACNDESCATPGSKRAVKSVLWASTGLVLIAQTTDLWAPYFY